jgi:hypothetical protein
LFSNNVLVRLSSSSAVSTSFHTNEIGFPCSKLDNLILA